MSKYLEALQRLENQRKASSRCPDPKITELLDPKRRQKQKINPYFITLGLAVLFFLAQGTFYWVGFFSGRVAHPLNSESPAKSFTIQMAAYPSAAQAAQEKHRLNNLGYSAYILEANSAFNVCLGHYATNGEAYQELLGIRHKTRNNAYKTAFIRVVKEGGSS